MTVSEHLLDSGDASLYDVVTHSEGPQGKLPLTPELLRNRPSGDLFGMTQDAGMGWPPAAVAGPQYVLLSTLGGLRGADGRPVALGWHTGHYELGMALAAAAEEFRRAGAVPYCGYCTDPCDGRTQGTAGMFDSLPYRNDAAVIFRRLARSIPTARGVLGVATCDKGLPAMMMALASFRDLACGLVPGGVTLPPTVGEDTGKIQSIGARFSRGEMSLEEASLEGCRVCASQGGGCHFLGTAATSQVVGEALGLTLPHAALAPSGQAIWRDMASRTAQAVMAMDRRRLKIRDVVTDASVRNAMVVFAAFGGSTNLLLHLPAIAHAAGLHRPTIDQWTDVIRRVPRLVSVLPNGPVNHPTVRVFLAGGVPEVMLHLARLGLLDLDAISISGCSVRDVLAWWETSPRRTALRQRLRQCDGVDPDDVIFTPDRAGELGVTSTLCFPRGNLAPEGAVIKCTAIDPCVVDTDGVYRKTGPARVFVREADAIAAVKGTAGCPIEPGDVIVLIGRGPIGSGMEETFQLTSALRYLSWGREVALLTDARFSGVSTGACIGMVGPEALAGGPLGKVRDGDRIRIVIDRNRLEGTVDLVGDCQRPFGPEEAARLLSERPPHPDLSPDPALPDDTRLWAALQQLGGGTWGGCVFDVERILDVVAGLERKQRPTRRLVECIHGVIPLDRGFGVRTTCRRFLSLSFSSLLSSLSDRRRAGSGKKGN
ncbi:MAG: YjhG/YagF family D-xylonate dehydratase [Rhodopirellula sp.]|nr:YjhG/YagF family D-xylonate dehydratase [Rhodopirellula sp.]